MVKELRYDVFLSHNSEDKSAVEILARRLTDEAGLQPFLDKWHLIPGVPWQEALEEALSQSETIAVFIGPSGMSPWHNEEMRAALDKAARTRDECRVIPVLLPGADLNSLSPFLARRTWVDFRSAIDDADTFNYLVSGILGKPPEQSSVFTLPDEPVPYTGLLPFTAQQSEFFFGRTQERNRLLERIRESPFVAVVGASGSGKSSLVMAGLLPKLEKDWRPLVLVPGVRPLRSLANQLIPLFSSEDHLKLADELENRFFTRTDGLSSALSTLLVSHQDITTVLIVIDQFEELFTQISGSPEEVQQQQRQFIENLVDSVRTPNGQVRIVITLRADFIRHCLEFPDFRTLLENHQQLLGSMNEEELREAIVKPSQMVGAMFEKGLVARIINDMHRQSTALPLMQLALTELWRHRNGVWLTHEVYDNIGGISGVINQQAETEYNKLDKAQQQLARNLFIRLVALGDRTSDTRRRVSHDELTSIGTDPVQVEKLIGILSHRDVRLIVANADTVELVHETLIEQWKTLQNYLNENRTVLLIHRRLTETAVEWTQNDRDTSYLYRGNRLAEAKKCITSNSLNKVEKEFLKESQQVERHAHHQRFRARIVLAGLALLLLTASSIILLQIFYWSRPLWKPVSGFPEDPVLSLAVTNESSSTYYVGTTNMGLGRSRDGMTWEFLGREGGLPTREEPVNGIAGKDVKGLSLLTVDLLDPNHIFAFVEERGIYRSNNGGETWKEAKHISSEERVRDLAVCGDLVLAILESRAYRALYRSNDGGNSWELAGGMGQEPLQHVHAVDIAPGNDGIYGNSDDQIYVSSDKGLFMSSSTPPGNWRHEVPIEQPVWNIVLDGSDFNSCYLTTFKLKKGESSIYHWNFEKKELKKIATFNVPPRDLAPSPDSTSSITLYVLLDNGQLLALTNNGKRIKLGELSGHFYRLLAAFRFDDKDTWLLVGHDKGLLEYVGPIPQ